MLCSYILVCFGCQIVPACYLDYVFAPPHRRASIIRFLLFVCPLHLSVSFICLRASVRPWSKSSFHGLPSPKVEIAPPSPPSPPVRPPRSNARLCPAQMSNQFSLSPIFRPSTPVCFCFFSPAHLLHLCIFVFFGGLGWFQFVKHRRTSASKSALCALV